ncbi:MAG: hypothetical protein WC223_05045 [Bacteroidales bacterium]|jgi:hypothetical protein
MTVEIQNAGTSLKIITDGSARYIVKQKIAEISVINDNILKIDIGEGSLYNIFITYSDVTAPQTANAAALRDAVHAMLQTNLTGFASEANQLSEISQLQAVQNITEDILLNLTQNIDLRFSFPTREDQTFPNVVYKGYAAAGALPSSAVWAILKVTNNMLTLSYCWADGNKNFDNVWNNRATLNYI